MIGADEVRTALESLQAPTGVYSQPSHSTSLLVLTERPSLTEPSESPQGFTVEVTVDGPRAPAQMSLELQWQLDPGRPLSQYTEQYVSLHTASATLSSVLI